jgi:hypothetical protein
MHMRPKIDFHGLHCKIDMRGPSKQHLCSFQQVNEDFQT